MIRRRRKEAKVVYEYVDYFVADDGTEFGSEEGCRTYERTVLANKYKMIKEQLKPYLMKDKNFGSLNTDVYEDNDSEYNHFWFLVPDANVYENLRCIFGSRGNLGAHYHFPTFVMVRTDNYSSELDDYEPGDWYYAETFEQSIKRAEMFFKAFGYEMNLERIENNG